MLIPASPEGTPRSSRMCNSLLCNRFAVLADDNVDDITEDQPVEFPMEDSAAGARSIQRNVRKRLVLSGIREREDAPVFPAPVLLQPSVRAAWLHRWRGLLACTAARSFAESLLGNTAPGVDGAVPSMRSVISATCCELWS